MSDEDEVFDWYDSTPVPTWALMRVLDYLDRDCRYDHHGLCQNHMLTKPCPVPFLRKALDERETLRRLAARLLEKDPQQ